MNTSELSNGERLVIERRRAGESQKSAAARYEVTLHQWRLWEADKDDPPTSPVGKLMPYEVCFLKRRRAGIQAQALAEELEVSRWWLTQIEYGRAPIDCLIQYWSARETPWRPKRRDLASVRS